MDTRGRSTLTESAAPAAKLEANSTTANVRANLTASPEGEGPGAPVGRPRYNPNIRKLFDGDETWAKATFELAAARSSTAATARNGRTSRNSGRSVDRSACMPVRAPDRALTKGGGGGDEEAIRRQPARSRLRRARPRAV